MDGPNHLITFVLLSAFFAQLYNCIANGKSERTIIAHSGKKGQVYK